MRILSVILACLGLFCLAQQGRGQILLTGVGAGSVSSGGGFTGIGDIASGAQGAWSCTRAYNAAYISGAQSLCDLNAVSGGAAVCTLKVAANGFADVSTSYCAGTTPPLACAAASGGSCVVSKMYDMTGNSHDGTQATASQMPALTFSGLGTCPVVTFSGGQWLNVAGTMHAASQPYSIVTAAKTTNVNAAIVQDIYADGNHNIQLGLDFAALNEFFAYAGNLATLTAADNTWWALAALYNGASSVMSLNGTPTPENLGTNSGTTTVVVLGGFFPNSNLFTGPVLETAVYTSDVSSSFGAISANERATCGGF